jgi:hypothetical protein
MSETRNIFISHEGEDDSHLQGMKQRLIDQGYDVRNYSVDSTNHNDEKRPSDAEIRETLRTRISWSSALICLIGEDTHKSDWVNFEIEEAKNQGKNIVGVYVHGCANDVELPEAFKKYGGTPLGWNSLDKLGDAIEGENMPAENPDSSPRAPIYKVTRVKC